MKCRILSDNIRLRWRGISVWTAQITLPDKGIANTRYYKNYWFSCLLFYSKVSSLGHFESYHLHRVGKDACHCGQLVDDLGEWAQQKKTAAFLLASTVDGCMSYVQVEFDYDCFFSTRGNRSRQRMRISRPLCRSKTQNQQMELFSGGFPYD